LDRAFQVRGAGTVVTGTLTGGSIDVGDSLVLVGPGGPPAAVRVRRLEALGRQRHRTGPGERVACNLTGGSKRLPVRGDALVGPGTFQMSACFDAMFEVLPNLGHPLTKRGAFTVHIGSGEYPAKVSLLGDVKLIEPGRGSAVRIRLSVALPLCLGDRFVVRESGRGETLGGGTMLDVAPVRSVSKAMPAGTVDGIIAERAFLDAGELWRQTGERRAPSVGQFVASPDALAGRLESLANRLRSAGSMGLELAELDEIDRVLVQRVEGASISFGHITTAGPGTVRTDDRWLAALREAPFRPEPPLGTTRGQLRELVQSGVVVEARGIHFAASAVEEATKRLALLLGESPDGVTLAELRSALGTSRRYALALLEHFDAEGITRRRGDVRVGGPQLARRVPSGRREPD
jgi:selenocysteine-specific elongation factor